MKTSLLAAAFAASLFAVQSLAQEDAQQGEAGQATKEEGEAKAVKAAQSFTTLPFCRLVEPPVEVKKPNGGWEPAEEGRFYPLGTSYRTHQGGKLVLSFGRTSTATMEGESSFGTRQQGLGDASRTMILAYGVVALNLADNLPEGAFFVTAPGFTVRNPAGESRYAYEQTPNGDRATVRCVTGSLGLSGRHFDIASMRAADEIVITSEHDYLATILEGTSGDYVVRLNQGIRSSMEVDDNGAMKEVVSNEFLDWHLSTRTKVVINRAVPAIGERMGVHTMAFDAAGELQSDRIFCEGRAEINSGELVVKAVSGEEMAKRAAEAAESTEEAEAEDAPTGNGEASSSGDSSSSSSSDE